MIRILRDVKLNNIWIQKDVDLELPLFFDTPEENVIIDAKITSTQEISFKVNNLIIFGEITTPGKITINTKSHFFLSGKIHSGNIIIKSPGFDRKLTKSVIEKIRTLGISLSNDLLLEVPQDLSQEIISQEIISQEIISPSEQGND